MSAVLRWEHYFLERGPGFHSFWGQHLNSSQHDVLLVVGAGFDPRTCDATRALIQAGGAGRRDCLLVAFDEGEDSPSNQYETRTTTNRTTLTALIDGKGDVSGVTVRMRTTEGRRIDSRSAADIVPSSAALGQYSDIVVDMSAMPRSVYFPLIGKLLHMLDDKQIAMPSGQIPNLHVVVAENANLDKRIQDAGIDEAASYLPGFGNELELESTAEVPKVWIPILGERQATQLEYIYDLVQPTEICPLLPSPSAWPRRADDLVVEYRGLLFDRWHVEPGNVIYAAEQNPFEAYRQICHAARQYDYALKALGGCKAAISANSSKLLSLGALLACYELKESGFATGMAHVPVHGYEIDDEEASGAPTSSSPPTDNSGAELFTTCIAGACYAA